MQEVQDSLDDWAVSLYQASSMKTDVSQYIMSEDMLMLQEQEEHLHGQWEQLCLKVNALLFYFSVNVVGEFQLDVAVSR